MALLLNTKVVKADIHSVSVTPLVENTQEPDRFEISGEPGSEHTLKLSITNFGIETLDIKIQPTNATTSPNGDIDIGESVVAGDYGLRTSFAEMTQPQMIRLKKNQTRNVTFKVKLPDQQLNGTVIGGFSIFDEKHPNAGHSGVGVYFGAQETSNKHSIKLQGITPEVHNSQPFLSVNLANYEAKTLENTTFQVKIKKNNWYNKLGINNNVDVQDVHFAKIAPNSKIPIEFNQKQTPIQSGNYLVEGVAKNGKQTWNFKQNYHVDGLAAQLVNKQSKNLIYDKTGFYVTIIGILTGVIILVFWGIAYQRR